MLILVFVFFYILLILLGVAFLTLLERSFLGAIHFRFGPLKVGFLGLLQPFSDALKLFNKVFMKLLKLNFYFYIIGPFYGFLIMMFLYLSYFYLGGYLNLKVGWIFLMFLFSANLYFLLSMSWSSLSVYSFYGCMRAVCQALAYEVVLIFFFLIYLIYRCFYEFDYDYFGYFFEFFWFYPLYFIWLLVLLFETNRSPYDLSEGESELVSGFNTEYYGGAFSVIFVVEYASLIFMGFIMMLLVNLSFFFVLMLFYLIMLFILWIRGSYPRIRYDVLMMMAWKYVLMFVLYNYFILLIL